MCGEGGSLRSLADLLNLDSRDYQTPVYVTAKKEQKFYSWMASADAIVRSQEGRSDVFERWTEYKPIKRSTIVSRRLGVGVLPASRCHHERLTVPVIDGSMIVGIRGRSLGCECGKWLAAGGTTLDMLPLYNCQALGTGQVVWIIENPIDALMVGERTDYIGVATYSVSYWREAWTEALTLARPELVVIAYANDLVGNGGALNRPVFEQEWLSRHPRLPRSNGPRLANHLECAGLPVSLFDWGKRPNKYDVGSLLTQEITA